MSDINNNVYDENSIDSLGIIGGVRAKPSSIGLENHSHTFIEILANAIDEAREGYGNKIIITKHKDNSISIQDFGRSVPMDKNDKGEYAYNKVFNELWSGGKYNNNEKKKRNYKYSLGTNGCGATGTNYCSDFFECTAISPNGHEYYIKYEEGIQKCELQKKPHNYDYSGTTIHWLPSKKCFRGSYIIEDIFITDILKQQSIVNANLKFIYINEINNTEEEFYYKEGIRDYILEVSKNKNITEIIQFSTEATGKEPEDDEDFDVKLNLFFTFNNEENLMEYYHNASFLENGGTPEDFIKNSFTYSIDKYIKDNKLCDKKESSIKFIDIQDSLIVVSDSYSTISLYSDQVKKKIKSNFMNSFFTNYLKEQLLVYLIENPIPAQLIANQVLINKRARETAEKLKIETKKKLNNKARKKVLKLVDCKSKNPEECEIYLVEGDSAGGNAKSARNRKTQAVLPQRGKSANVQRKKINVHKAEDLINIHDSIGVKYGKECRIEDCNYHHIICMADADPDGYGHIVSLWLTYFFKYYRPLIEAGYLYIAMPPLYKNVVKNKKEELIVYTYSEEEQLNYLKDNKPIVIQRYKGLGEMSANQLWETTMNPETRKLIQVTIEDEQECIDTFELLMGDTVEPRCDFILKNAKFAKNY